MTFRDALARLQYTNEFRNAYLLMMVLNGCLIVWALFDTEATMSKWLCEVIITVILAADIGMRIIVERENYWRDKSNLFDVFVFTVCLWTLSEHHSFNHEDTESLLDATLLFIRYGMQYMRLFMIVKNRRRLSEDTYLDLGEGVDAIKLTVTEEELEYPKSRDKDSTLPL